MTYYSQFRYWRFTAIQLRDGTSNITSPNIRSVGVLTDGCPVFGTSFLTTDGSSMLRSFTTPINVNGWYFETSSDGPVDSDPVEFAIQGSNNMMVHPPNPRPQTPKLPSIQTSKPSTPMPQTPNQDWFDFSGSKWSTLQHGDRTLRPGAYLTSPSRGYRDMFDMRHPWHWLVGRLVPDFVISVCLMAIAACGYQQELRVSPEP